MIWMDVDAALTAVPVNLVALIDDTDFKTREESVTYDQAGMDLVWNFVTTAGAYTQTAVTPTTSGVYDWTNKGNGMYAIEIPASGGGSINNDAEGFGWFTGFATGILPWTGPIVGFRAAGLNNLLVDDAFSATRGLAGTALPAAVADAAGGLPISDAGGLDLDAIPTSLTAVDVKQDRNMDLVQHLRGFHTHQGNVYYVAPANGNDSNSGTRASPYATIDGAINDLVTSGNHDTIIVLADDSPGVTTHIQPGSAAIECDKRYFSILGPGRDLIVTRDSAGNTFEITADGIEISGFQIGTHNAGSGDAINVTGADFHRIHHCWFLDTQGDGVHILRGNNTQIHDNHFEGTGVGGSGQGIHIVGTAGSSNDNVIHNNHFANTAGDSILIEQGTTNDTEIHHNTIHDSVAWGINIGASSNDAQVHSNILGNNASGNINDGGTTSIIKNNREWLSGTDATTQDGESNTVGVAATGFIEGVEGLTLVRTTIATLASQTSFTLTAGSTDDTAYRGLVIVIEDATTTAQKAFSLISAYTGATKTITLPVDPGVFTMAIGDKVTIQATATAPGIWDRILTGSTHNIATSAGRRLREIDDLLGYQGGAVWLDTENGVAGDTPGDNGTVDNPTDNITDAITIAVAKGLVRIRVASGSTVPLVAALEGYEIFNTNWTLQLENQSISGSCIIGATVSGIATGANAPKFIGCHFGNATLPPCHTVRCGLSGTITAGSAGNFYFEAWHSMVAGTSAPVFDFGSGLNASNVNFRHGSGGIEIQNMGAGSGSYNMSLEGDGQLIVNANCSATSTIAIRGHFTISGDATAIAAITFSEDARFHNRASIEAIKVVTDALTAAAAAKLALSAGTVVTGAAEAGTLSTTQMTSDLTEATDDHYNGRIVIWTSGVLKDQASDITDYSGATGLLTYTAVTEAPSAADTFVIV